MRKNDITTTMTASGKIIKQSVENKINWCNKTKAELIDKRPMYEKIVFDRLRKGRKTNAFIQQRFELGGHIYFADIYIAKWKMIIEIDGEYHNSPKRKAIDKERDRLCEAESIRVYRITNSDVENETTLNEFMDIINSTQPLSKTMPPLQEKEYKFLATPNFLESGKFCGLRVLCKHNGKYKHRTIQHRKKDVRNGIDKDF